METSRLEIGCAAIKYLVPAGHPSPLRIRDRLDTVILRRELPRTLARAFDSWFSDSDPSIWIIQQLDIEAAVNAGRRSGAHHPGIGDPARQELERDAARRRIKITSVTFQIAPPIWRAFCPTWHSGRHGASGITHRSPD